MLQQPSTNAGPTEKMQLLLQALSWVSRSSAQLPTSDAEQSAMHLVRVCSISGQINVLYYIT